MHFYGRLPEEYVFVRSWTIYDLVDDWILHSTEKPGRQIIFYLFGVACIAALMVWGSGNIVSFPDIGAGTYILINIVLLFITIVVHEIAHALVIIYYGGSPRFGAKWLRGLGPVVYVTTDGLFTVHAYKRVAAAPLVIISIACVFGVFLGIGWWLIVPFVFNAIGAGGDLLSLRVLQRYPTEYLIKDTKDGFDAYKIQMHESIMR